MKRPIIGDYQDLEAYIKAMLAFRKKSHRGFSVLRACMGLRRTSPTLVSLVTQGKRRLSLDRLEEFSQLLALTPTEREYLKKWIQPPSSLESIPQEQGLKRRKASVHLLKDWLNVYVKDAFQLKAVRKDPQLLFALLSPIAPVKRIRRCLDFLLKEGYLRRNSQGEIIEDSSFHSVDEKEAHKYIRAFHSAALRNAIRGLELYSIERRHAQSLVLTLDQAQYQEIVGELENFGEKIQSIAEKIPEGKVLYQLAINLSPVGGHFE